MESEIYMNITTEMDISNNKKKNYHEWKHEFEHIEPKNEPKTKR